MADAFTFGGAVKPYAPPAAAKPVTNEAYSIPTRKALNDMGVSNERIGFNPASGYVSVDGRDTIKPQSNVDGTTYTDDSSINSIRGNVGQLNNAYTLQQKVMNPQQQVNPIDQQFNQLLQTLQGRIISPQAIDPYTTPQYAAAQLQMQQAADRGIRANQEATGASGFGRSTINTQGAQRIQNQADQNLQTQVVPGIIQQLQADKQQELGNLMGLLGTLGQQQGLYDQRQNHEFDQASKVLDFITGRQDRTDDRQYQTGRDAVKDNQWTQTMEYQKMSDKEKMDYTKARDLIADDQYKEKFDEDVRRFGLTFAADEAYKAGQLKIQQQNANTSAASAANAATNSRLSNARADSAAESAAEAKRISNLYEIWDRTGRAPDGIPGVEVGTPIAGKTPIPTESSKKNSIYADMVSVLDQLDPAGMKNFFSQEKQNILRDLGPEGYDRLYGNYYSKFKNLK